MAATSLAAAATAATRGLWAAAAATGRGVIETTHLRPTREIHSLRAPVQDVSLRADLERGLQMVMILATTVVMNRTGLAGRPMMLTVAAQISTTENPTAATPHARRLIR